MTLRTSRDLEKSIYLRFDSPKVGTNTRIIRIQLPISVLALLFAIPPRPAATLNSAGIRNALMGSARARKFLNP